MRMTGLDMSRATHGRWHGKVPESVNGVATDTRGFVAGEAFLALRGPNFDGHHFAAAVADQAVALIGDSEGLSQWSELDASMLEVEDTLQAFGEIAHAWRKQLSQTTVIAISGSYGKTSLRSMLELGFSGLGYKVAATRANLNNLIGVPQTLLAVTAESDIALIECGISDPRDMDRLSTIVNADLAVLTGITSAHAEGLGGLEGVVREKAALFDHLAADAWCALGEGVAEQLSGFGIAVDNSLLLANQSGAVQWQLDGKRLRLFDGQENASIELALPAAHWAANLALAAGIMLRFSRQQGRAVCLTEISQILANWQAPAGRMQRLTGGNGSLILDDCYNANPVSMQAALDTLVAMDGRRIVFLGDMAELGEDSVAAHASLQLANIDQVYLIGPQMQVLAEACANAVWFETTAEAEQFCRTTSFDANDTILIKASRSMGLEKIVACLSEQASKEGAAHAV
ncbi:MAG: UDP-N-acetylmuramoyl-tripeptide--D-alanyl-D-alanine ligase [Mariprofundus sp.]